MIRVHRCYDCNENTEKYFCLCNNCEGKYLLNVIEERVANCSENRCKNVYRYEYNEKKYCKTHLMKNIRIVKRVDNKDKVRNYIRDRQHELDNFNKNNTNMDISMCGRCFVVRNVEMFQKEDDERVHLHCNICRDKREKTREKVRVKKRALKAA